MDECAPPAAQDESQKQMAEMKADPFLASSEWEAVREHADLAILFRPVT